MAHAKAGESLPVPNVQALAQTWNGSGEQVPDRYVRTEKTGAEEVVAGCAIPVVDLSRLLDPGRRKRSSQTSELPAATGVSFMYVHGCYALSTPVYACIDLQLD
jgi:hypothetical protein